ncbi:hypothetical protein JCM11251_005680 [Rhodosporidiobolus azoricus]
MGSRYLVPSPPGSAYNSSAASSPNLASTSSSSSHGAYSPHPSPYAYETLSPDAYQSQTGYFEQQRTAPPPRTTSYQNQHFPRNASLPVQQHPQQPVYRDLRAQRSFHHQPQYAQGPPPPQPQHHYQQRRPAPLRKASLPSIHGHLPSHAANAPPLPSPAASSFSSVSYGGITSPASSSFPVPPRSPYAQPSHNSSTVSLGLTAASFPLSPTEPTPASAPIAGEGDWAFASVISPSLLVSCEQTPTGNLNHREVVYRDAQTQRPLYIAREFRRGKNGKLLGAAELKGSDGLIWPEWHDGLEASTVIGGDSDGEKGAVEHLLLECPSSNAIRRAHLAGELAEPQKLGLVTEEVLYLRGGKKVAWGRFFKKSWFGSSDREGSWKGVDGVKFRWQREERKGAYEGEAVLKLLDEKTKEVMVVVREVEGKPSQLICSALVLPSIQPVLLTLLYRSYADDAKRLKKDQQEWEEEEGRSW